LALLPACLGDGIKLEAGGNAKANGRDMIGVRITGEPFGGQAILYFDRKSGLLVKSQRRMPHPLSGQEMDGEAVFGDYKETWGTQYPHRITSFAGGKKIIEMEITRIELLKKLDDRLFEKPNQ